MGGLETAEMKHWEERSGGEREAVAKTGGSWCGWRWRRLRRAVKAGGGQDGGGARGGGGGLSGRQRRWSW